ncbi:MAG TPA: Txe/YoeB family addiction module toxin [Prolixibacteraceae bacterium]|nr:Txe/YoeB family addiction module toxin [Prolixibacteraceae bacterium]
MEIAYTDDALTDIKFWKNSGDIRVQKKIQALIKELETHPTLGTGQPEQLKGNLSNFWSRRINKKDRLIYDIDNTSNIITIYSIKGHYK